jgi:hypothetical protein
MKKLSIQLIKELTNLSVTIPSGFKGLFAKTSGLWVKKSDNSESRILTTDDIINADLLDGKHVSDLAKIDTAFTTWSNISGNYPNIHIYVLDAVNHYDIQTHLSNISNNDTNMKVAILQPGTYLAQYGMYLYSSAWLGILGLSKFDTIIEVTALETFLETSFMENLTLKLTSIPGDLFPIVQAVVDKSSYIKSVDIINTDYVNGIDFIGFRNFSNMVNIKTTDCSMPFDNCSNLSNINVGVFNAVAQAPQAIFYKCSNASNINVEINGFLNVFDLCSGISNFKVISELSSEITCFLDSFNISNGCISTFEFAVLSGNNISDIKCDSCNVSISNSKNISNTSAYNGNIAFDRCTQISNCYAFTMSDAGFSDSDKLSTNIAASCYNGFVNCNGMVNNQSVSSTNRAYDTCYADMSTTYPVGDSPNGGWNA